MSPKLIDYIENKLVQKSVELKRSLFPYEVVGIFIAAFKHHKLHLVKEDHDYARTK